MSTLEQSLVKVSTTQDETCVRAGLSTSQLQPHGDARNSFVPGQRVEDFTGPYDFKVTVPEEHETYSSECGVYARRCQYVPFEYQWTYRSETRRMRVRSILVFMPVEGTIVCVEPCKKHRKGIAARASHAMLSCSAAGSRGVWHPAGAVLVQYARHGPGACSHAYFFPCNNSCFSGSSTAIIFRLEDLNGTVHGQQTMKIQICAHPGRDISKKRQSDQPSTSTIAKKSKLTLQKVEDVLNELAEKAAALKADVEIYSKLNDDDDNSTTTSEDEDNSTTTSEDSS